MKAETRPWGSFRTLSKTETHHVKELIVNPLSKLSLQKHNHRKEHWYIVSGSAVVTIDDEVYLGTSGDSFDIPLGAIHRLECNGLVPLVIIEVQTGTYFGEDDIIRYSDDYGRI
jgi:mannose-6-phosphate isomerase-like protein (cupin superfamily)